jgi:hypothetical protein
VITAENIHEVKVALYGKFLTLHKQSVTWKASAFTILPPYFLPQTLDRDSAKTFFDEIKIQKKFKPGQPKLSWWLIAEIE